MRCRVRGRRMYSLSSLPLSAFFMEMDISGSSTTSPSKLKLTPIEATPETFKEFGQVIGPSPDGQKFGPQDAQLDLSRGVPRLYIMHLENQPLDFSVLTHHANVTQCLGSVGGHVWYIAVAKPSIRDPDENKGNAGESVRQSHSGHFYVPPAVEDVRVFRISGPKFLKLNHGTWHNGPLFMADYMDFYNLELTNTNVIDHTNHNFLRENGVVIVVDE